MESRDSASGGKARTAGESSLNVLLVAEESAGIQTLRLLADLPHRVVGVMARRHSDAKVATVWNVATGMNLAIWPAELVKEAAFAREIERLRVDLLLNVHSLYIIDEELLGACRIGAFIMHPGPLPEYAGLNVPSWAIYSGETEHGVTVREIIPRLDAGPIVNESRFPIESSDTGLSLMLKCVREGLPLIERLVTTAAVSAGAIPRREQDLRLRHYFHGAPPDNGWLRWNRSAREIVNHVRASDYSPFPSPWGHPLTRLDDREVGIVKVERTGQPTDSPPGTAGE